MSDPLGFINRAGAGGVNGLGTGQPPAGGQRLDPNAPSFKNLLMENIKQVNSLQQERRQRSRTSRPASATTSKASCSLRKRPTPPSACSSACATRCSRPTKRSSSSGCKPGVGCHWQLAAGAPRVNSACVRDRPFLRILIAHCAFQAHSLHQPTLHHAAGCRVDIGVTFARRFGRRPAPDGPVASHL